MKPAPPTAATPLSAEDLRALRSSCTRSLNHHPAEARRPLAVLQRLVAVVGADEGPDQYGEGAIITDFEGRVAALLGKPAARFFPSGTMAQLVALRAWPQRTDGQRTDGQRTDGQRLAMHPTSHLQLHEQQAYRHLHGIGAVLLGAPDRGVVLDDLRALPPDVGVVLLELPMRELGGVLPPWPMLLDMVACVRDQGARLHLDGARLWEAAAGYDRDVAEIAALFDSVYVSFYKGLGGIAGAVLAGPEPFLQDAAPWQRRHGGNLISMWPYVVAARDGLDTRLPRMPLYRAHMLAIADALRPLEGVRVTPDPPDVNMVHLLMAAPAPALTLAMHEVSRRTGVWLFGAVRPGPQPDQGKVELVVGDATLGFPPSEVAALFAHVLELAGALEP